MVLFKSFIVWFEKKKKVPYLKAWGWKYDYLYCLASRKIGDIETRRQIREAFQLKTDFKFVIKYINDFSGRIKTEDATEKGDLGANPINRAK